MKTTQHFAATRMGRMVLHLFCSLRHPAHVGWHWQGVRREFLPAVHCLALLALVALPGLAGAQGTYLSAPDGNPVNAVVVAPGGNVGIGIENPSDPLHLHAAGGSTGRMRISKDGLTSEIQLGVSSPGDYGFLVLNDRTILRGGSTTSSHIDGKLGIGTTSPLAKLHVAGDMRIQNQGPGAILLTFFTERAWSFRQHGSGGSTALELANSQGKDFIINTSGNVGIGTTTPSADLEVAGNIKCQVLELTSDRAQKAGLQPLDNQALLEKVVNLPLTSWHYTNAPSVRHIGPMAQDFKTAFGFGESDQHISIVDGLGVALGAIQGLHEVVKEKETRITALERQLDAVQAVAARVRALEAVLARITPPDSAPTPATAPGELRSQTGVTSVE